MEQLGIFITAVSTSETDIDTNTNTGTYQYRNCHPWATITRKYTTRTAISTVIKIVMPLSFRES